MKTRSITLLLSTVVLLTACAGQTAPGAGKFSSAKADEHAAHQAAAASSKTPPAMHERMKDMQAMRDKMKNAKTPAERQALMAEHMKSMHEGMEMMKGVGGMHGMPGMPGMTEAKPVPMHSASHQQMMEMRMDMMQSMMEMMMQRMPGATAPPTNQ